MLFGIFYLRQQINLNQIYLKTKLNEQVTCQREKEETKWETDKRTDPDQEQLL